VPNDPEVGFRQPGEAKELLRGKKMDGRMGNKRIIWDPEKRGSQLHDRASKNQLAQEAYGEGYTHWK